MRRAKRFLLVVPLLSGLLVPSFALGDTWTDVSGKHTIEAKFLSVAGGKVYLEKADGTRIAVPIKQLSPESLAQAKAAYEASKGASSTAVVPRDASMKAASAPSGKSKLGSNPTARETAEALTAAVAEFDMVTMWDAFPPKYQDDITGTIQLAAKSIDSSMWNSVTGLLKKASRLVSEKKEFFMGNAMIGQQMPPGPETDKVWDASAALLAAYVNSSITNQNTMKSFDMDNFIAKDVPKLRAAYTELQALTEDLDDSPFGQISEVPTIEVVSESSDKAVFKVTTNGETEEQTVVKVDNRWLPEDMVRDWDKEIQKAHESLKQLATPEGQQGMMQAQMMLGMVGGPIDQMLAANSQQEFDNVINGIMQMAMGMMGGMGGPGGPGGFGPGGPGGFGPGGPGGGPPPGFGGDAFPDDF